MMQENATGEPIKNTTKTIYLPVELKEWLAEQAKREGRSASGLYVWLLKEYRNKVEGTL